MESWNNPLDSVKEYSYAQDITEDIILRNMNMAVAQLKRFGLSFWNVDDGYMNNHILNIDDVDLNRFPNGMKYIADQMHAQGQSRFFGLTHLMWEKNQSYGRNISTIIGFQIPIHPSPSKIDGAP